MRSLSLFDLAFLGSLVAPEQIYDDMESYADAAAVNGLNGGTGFGLAAYVDRSGPFGLQAVDNIESYSDAAALNALNGGNGFAGAYVDRFQAFGLVAGDDMESYSDTAALNGLNGGVSYNGFAGFTAAYVDR